MKKIYSFLIALVSMLTLGAINTNAALTVTNIKGSAADGIVITFSEDLKSVNHNAFDTPKCATFLDPKGNAPTTPQNVSRTFSGNTVVLKTTYGSNLIDGHEITVTLTPECFIGVSGATLTGQTEFTFTLGEVKKGGITVEAFTPTAQVRQSLNSISVTFSAKVTAILDEKGIAVKNQNGHSLKLASVALDTENPLGAVTMNIDENEVPQEGTTYKCYIDAFALGFDGEININEEEIVFGGWEIAVTPITLTLEPAANSVVESLSSVIVKGNRAMDFVGKPSDITVSGIMEYQVNTYAHGTSVVKNADGSYTVTFDKTIEPGFENDVKDIASSHADKDNVRINIPAGTFKAGAAENRQTQAIYVIKKNVTLGEITWTFNPAEGAEVDVLGVPSTTEDENGTKTVYSIDFTIEEENGNLWTRIPDASGVKILREDGTAQKSFGQFDILGGDGRHFSLDLGTNPLTAYGPAAKSGEFTLYIPAEAVYYYTDANYYTEPTHPEEDIYVTWTLKDTTTGIKAVVTGKGYAKHFNAAGQRVNTNAKGLVISEGKKVVK